MLYAPVTCLGSCQLGSIWTSADGEVPEKEMSTQKKSVWFYLECKKVVCIFLTKDKWSTSISVPQERLNYRKEKSRSLQTLKQFFTIHKTNQALQKVRTQKTCGETWRANFLNLPPPADGQEIYFRTMAAYRFPGISDIHYDSRVLKNKLGVIICSRRHRWYMGGTSYYWMYRSLFPCLGKHLRRVAPGTGCRGQMR